MKIISLLMTPKDIRRKFQKTFLLSPYLSVRSVCYHPPLQKSILSRFLSFLLLTTLILVFGKYRSPLQSYEVMILAPTIYFFTETLGTFGQILFFRTRTFPIHRRPLFATSLSHFWGRDWNVWVQDWLRDLGSIIPRHKKNLRIVTVFLISGLFHEVMCNLPYWLYFKESYFGTMMAYFLIQAVALWLDKKWVRKWPLFWRRIYLWCAVIIPSPLFINVPLLTFFGLTT